MDHPPDKPAPPNMKKRKIVNPYLKKPKTVSQKNNDLGTTARETSTSLSSTTLTSRPSSSGRATRLDESSKNAILSGERVSRDQAGTQSSATSSGASSNLSINNGNAFDYGMSWPDGSSVAQGESTMDSQPSHSSINEDVGVAKKEELEKEVASISNGAIEDSLPVQRDRGMGRKNCPCLSSASEFEGDIDWASVDFDGLMTAAEGRIQQSCTAADVVTREHLSVTNKSVEVNKDMDCNDRNPAQMPDNAHGPLAQNKENVTVTNAAVIGENNVMCLHAHHRNSTLGNTNETSVRKAPRHRLSGEFDCSIDWGSIDFDTLAPAVNGRQKVSSREKASSTVDVAKTEPELQPIADAQEIMKNPLPLVQPRQSEAHSCGSKDVSMLPPKVSLDTSVKTEVSRPSTASSVASNNSAQGSSNRTSTSTDSQSIPRILSYAPKRVQPVDDEFRKPLIENAQLSTPLLNGWTLFPHQREAVMHGLKMRRSIVAYEMGLGKTIIGCVWAKAFKSTFPSLKLYVICPVSLKAEWKKTALEATGLDTEEEKKSKCRNEEGDNEPSLDIAISSWAKVPQMVPSNVKHYIIVCDEAHSMQSMASDRTKNVLKLVKTRRCVGAMLLTGTPMKNGKPLNLFPLLHAVRHPFGDNQKLFETYFCNGHDKRYGSQRVVWDANGSSNLPQLRAHIASHVIHKTKEDCLKNLPKKTRHFRKVPVSSRDELRHTEALHDMFRIMDTAKQDPSEESNDAILGAVTRLKQIASFAKIDATVALVKSILENEPAVVIFTGFVDTAKAIHSKLCASGWNGVVFTGETPQKKRQLLVNDFQEGIIPVFIGTFGAGGVGLTLTAASTIILTDRPWTPGEALQAEDRVRRIGQTKEVNSIWITAFDVDEQIDGILQQKEQTAYSVIDGRGSEEVSSDPKSSPKISIHQLISQIRKKNQDSLKG